MTEEMPKQIWTQLTEVQPKFTAIQKWDKQEFVGGTKYIRADRHEVALAVIEVMKGALEFDCQCHEGGTLPYRPAYERGLKALAAVREFEGEK